MSNVMRNGPAFLLRMMSARSERGTVRAAMLQSLHMHRKKFRRRIGFHEVIDRELVRGSAFELDEVVARLAALCAIDADLPIAEAGERAAGEINLVAGTRMHIGMLAFIERVRRNRFHRCAPLQ